MTNYNHEAILCIEVTR